MLCLLSGGSALSFDQIKQATGIPDHYLKACLHSMFAGKQQVLSKSDEPKKIKDTDVLKANSKFSYPRKTFEIKMSAVEDKSQGPRVDNTSRHPLLDAVVVRLMKVGEYKDMCS